MEDVCVVFGLAFIICHWEYILSIIGGQWDWIANHVGAQKSESIGLDGHPKLKLIIQLAKAGDGRGVPAVI